MSRMFTLAAAITLAAAALAPAAAAQTDRQAGSINVSYADLDISSPAGAETLIWRMKSATTKVCGKRPSPRLIEATARHAACTSGAMLAAVEALDVPTVTALFNGTSGKTEIAGR